MKIMSARHTLHTGRLQREVVIDCYYAADTTGPVQLLLLNDGQHATTLDLAAKLAKQIAGKPILIAAIHAGPQRLQEYGTARLVNERGQGLKATAYTRFVIRELLPFLEQQYAAMQFTQKAFGGFSLGGLSALDIVWQHPSVFQIAGVFSGALWWRSRALDAGYNEATDRIMHKLVSGKGFQPGLRFFFACGTEEETADRNHNGIIDVIDDTQDMVRILTGLGYKDVRYLEIAGGRHDEATWGQGLDAFLDWL
ncbi:Putative esterase [Chitinophaga costaii]|uniref:Putative esterase n=1 Tax=Chitinophaga costaii TaxID=1335309 RepID=A0A1C4ERQ7_9BACT|nr:alpha/beta hydrolase-fold protein [Chitinophaga costaii]SCC46203.1 Putative esterase [Chitinophaga costaii]